MAMAKRLAVGKKAVVVEAADWAMEFSREKCKIMHVGRNNPRNKYYMNGVELSVTEEERDLGVWTDSTSLVPLYKSLVRPKMEPMV